MSAVENPLLSSAAFHILLSLSNAERHGYEIMQDVEMTTDGRTRLGPGTLYSTIKRLLGEKLIEESGKRPPARNDDERRRYYKLTALGKRALNAEASRLNNLVKTARRRGIAVA